MITALAVFDATGREGDEEPGITISRHDMIDHLSITVDGVDIAKSRRGDAVWNPRDRMAFMMQEDHG